MGKSGLVRRTRKFMLCSTNSWADYLNAYILCVPNSQSTPTGSHIYNGLIYRIHQAGEGGDLVKIQENTKQIHNFTIQSFHN